MKKVNLSVPADHSRERAGHDGIMNRMNAVKSRRALSICSLPSASIQPRRPRRNGGEPADGYAVEKD